MRGASAPVAPVPPGADDTLYLRYDSPGLGQIPHARFTIRRFEDDGSVRLISASCQLGSDLSFLGNHKGYAALRLMRLAERHVLLADGTVLAVGQAIECEA